MHLPTKSINLKTVKFPQVRLGLQGDPGSGKTTSALTAPNPVVLDIDGGLTKFSGHDIIVVPIYDYQWVCDYGFEPKKPKAQPNRRDAILKFMQEDALKLTSEQTLIIDSWTSLQTAFDMQQDLEPAITKSGQIDEFAFWMRKIEYSEKIMTYICSLKASVVVTFHELKVRDIKTGQLLEKVQPLMAGKFYSQIKRFFTDFFRLINEEEKDKEGRVIKCNYYWQVCSDNQFDSKTRLTFPEGTFKVKPDFSVFSQYERKV